MRYLILLALVSSPVLAQSADSDPQVLQKLLSEVHQLRMAIERSTLLGARTQLALTRLQMQQSAADRLAQQLYDLRQQGIELSHKRDQDAARKKEAEDSLPTITNPDQRRDFETMLKSITAEIDQIAAQDQARSAHENELANQLQAAQNELAATRAQIAEMERSLDAAIQQLIQ